MSWRGGRLFLGELPRLSSHNYQAWRERVRTILEANGLDPGAEAPKPDGAQDTGQSEEWEERNAVAKAVISGSLEDEQLVYVRECNTAKEMLEKIHRRFGFRSVDHQTVWIKELVKMRLESKKNCEKYIAALITIFDNLKLTGLELTDRQKLGFLYGTLGEQFETFVAVLESKPELKFDEAIGRLREECMQKRTSPHPDSTSRGSNYRASRKGRNQGPPQNQLQRCFNCDGKGHFAKDCPSAKRPSANSSYPNLR